MEEVNEEDRGRRKGVPAPATETMMMEIAEYQTPDDTRGNRCTSLKSSSVADGDDDDERRYVIHPSNHLNCGME